MATAENDVADVQKEDDCARMVEQATTRFGRLTALVNNAGIAGPTKTLDALSPLRVEVSELDVARLVAYLLSPGGQHMTGQDLNVSAGTVMY